MARETLTERNVKSLGVDREGDPRCLRTDYFDLHPESPRGFVLRVTDKSRVYYLVTSLRGKRTWVRIDDAQRASLKDARRAAKIRAGEIAAGRDLNAEKRAETRRREAERLATVQAANEWTIVRMVQAYTDARPQVSKATSDTRQSIMRCYIEKLVMPARDVTREDVRRIISPLVKR